MHWIITLCFVYVTINLSASVFRIDQVIKNQKIVPGLINVGTSKKLSQIIRLKSDLANSYNQDIERLKLEQKSLKSQVEAELSKLKKDKIYNKTTSEIDVDANKVKKADKVNQNVDAEKIKEIRKSNKTDKPKQTAPAGNPTPIDFGRLDLRVGKIVNACKHPNADALYVESIEVGDPLPRNVVSGLVKFIPMVDLQDRMVILLCNLKPSKIRGILSEAMVMCASSSDNVELLEPPPGSKVGDIVTIDGYTRNPDKVLKVLDQILPDLKTNKNCQATYKGIPWKVNNTGIVTTESLTNVQIK